MLRRRFYLQRENSERTDEAQQTYEIGPECADCVIYNYFFLKPVLEKGHFCVSLYIV